MRLFALAATCALFWTESGCHTRPDFTNGPTEWSPAELPASPSARVSALGGSGPNDVWAALDFGPSGAVRLALFHFDGHRWSQAASPAELQFPLRDIYAVASSDVWAVGGHGEVIHFDGATWSVSRIPHAVALDDDFTRVRAWPNEAWVTTTMSRGRYYRFHDGAWTLEQTARPDMTFSEFWGVTPNDVWFAGARSQHFDGTAWHEVAVGAATLRDVHGTARDDVWMVGGRGSSFSEYNWRGAAFHWNGVQWMETPVPSGILFLNRVYAVSRTEAWAVGAGADAVRWDGHTWRRSITGFEHAHGLPSMAVLFASVGSAWTSGRAVPGLLTRTPSLTR